MKINKKTAMGAFSLTFLLGIILGMSGVLADKITFTTEENKSFYTCGFNEDNIYFIGNTSGTENVLHLCQLSGDTPYLYVGDNPSYPRHFSLNYTDGYLRNTGGAGVNATLHRWNFNISSSIFNSTGTYNLVANFYDYANTTPQQSYNVSVRIILDRTYYGNTTFVISPNDTQPINYSLPDKGVEIYFKTNSTYCGTQNCTGSEQWEADYVHVIIYNKSVENISTYESKGNFFTILESSNVKNALLWNNIKLWYDETKVANEDLLKLGWYNKTSNKTELCENSVVDKNNNYVSCNSTHFSEWGIFEEPAPTPTPSSPPASSGSSSGGSYYSEPINIPITTVNKTINKTTILPVQVLDCLNIILPQNSICNESGVYIPPQIKLERVEVPKYITITPSWVYFTIAIAVVSSLIALYFIYANARGKKK